MKRIEEIDKNFIVNTLISRSDVECFNAFAEPFCLHGLLPQTQAVPMVRMQRNIAQSVSGSVETLNTNCSGGRVRFCTDADYIAIKTEYYDVGKMPHFALTGSAGFDLYSETRHIATFQPPFDVSEGMISEADLEGGDMTEYTLNLPLYSGIKQLYIFLPIGASLKPALPYKYDKPFVFYGSSITQGGCASRPGCTYPAIISRRMDADFINLGFSGSALGEKEIADYIAGLSMSAFVLDYDHNSPTDEHLNDTHEAFYKIVRASQPDLPIICVTRPYAEALDGVRKEIVKKTFDNARVAGDENIYYIDMDAYFKENGISDMATVDRCHPNDLGFFYMAQIIEETLKRALK